MSTNESASKDLKKTSSPAYSLLLVAGVFMLVGLGFLIYLGREEVRLRGVSVAELEFEALVYADKDLDEEARKGKVVVLYFWGFWNKPSIDPYSEIAALQKEFLNSSDVIVASISCEQRPQDTRDELVFYTKKFLDKNKIEDMPIYCDPAQYSRSQISRLFSSGGFVYPTTLVIDGEGKVEGAWRNHVKIDRIRSAVESARKRLAKK